MISYLIGKYEKQFFFNVNGIEIIKTRFFNTLSYIKRHFLHEHTYLTIKKHGLG